MMMRLPDERDAGHGVQHHIDEALVVEQCRLVLFVRAVVLLLLLLLLLIYVFY